MAYQTMTSDSGGIQVLSSSEIDAEKCKKNIEEKARPLSNAFNIYSGHSSGSNAAAVSNAISNFNRFIELTKRTGVVATKDANRILEIAEIICRQDESLAYWGFYP